MHGSVSLPLDSDQHTPVQPGDLVKSIGDREAIQVALNELTVDLRQTFLMVAVEELTCREAAEQLKIPLGTVLSRLDRARRALRGTILRTTSHKDESRSSVSQSDPTMHKVIR